MTEGRIITITAPTREEADHLGRLAVEHRLAACAQVHGPITSTYWWQGTIETAEEWVCMVKTVADRTDLAVAVLRAAHSYDTPEIVVVRIEGGDERYLEWLVAETRSAER
jgi:periplasmic divalent cation tolerance protein